MNKIINIFNNKCNNKYEIYDNTLYFRNDFNEEMNMKLRNKLYKCNKIVFMEEKSYKLHKSCKSSNYYYNYINCYPTPRNIFNKSISNLPLTIKQIDFGYHFNQPVDRLPPLLENLKFNYDFNQTVDNLPPFLLSLEFGYYFNKPINKLPYLLQNIKLNFCFNQSIDKLPIFVTKVIINCTFIHSVNKLPDFIDIIELGSASLTEPIKRLPKMLKKLILSEESMYFSNIPLHENLEYLELGRWFSGDLNFNFTNNRLNTLILHSDCHKYKNLPESIKTLTLVLVYINIDLLNNLPNSIEELTLTDTVYIHDNLKLYSKLNSELNNVLNNLPNSIKKLNLKKTTIQLILDNLPNSIEHLSLPINYDLVINKLPKNIMVIECNKTYKFIKNLKKNKKIKIIFYNNLFN